ncbi:hypothetical protein EMQU_1691 [Enterococcus mundtii QU 25]|uniref:Uncharacterized protein n=1 Tax=Enterococcus mundtii TaxID=53346 RepID=A0AAI8R786_ENTMU|nr:hypothetical protein EMQU_1691 [Enterococcus mundtii QU 25]BBM13588.1 uncharacterized protein EM151A_0346 [Enterococcus mundtii]GKS55416.1 hypothetical protein EMLAB_20310 [Enterococcus mundtii]
MIFSACGVSQICIYSTSGKHYYCCFYEALSARYSGTFVVTGGISISYFKINIYSEVKDFLMTWVNKKRRCGTY